MIEVKISILLPTYNERENIEQLIKSIARSMQGYNYEIVVIDDNSPDGTADVAQALSTIFPVRVLRRPGKLGLVSAIHDGIKASTGEVIVVMDADFQHPPEVIPRLLGRINECDIVIASRYVEGGGITGWSPLRRIVSMGAIVLARLLVSRARRVRDPVSGFFALRKEIANKWTPLAPRGYKALLEILAVARKAKICEEPYVFKSRQHGKSKLGLKQILSYVGVLARINPVGFGLLVFLLLAVLIVLIKLILLYVP